MGGADRANGQMAGEKKNRTLTYWTLTAKTAYFKIMTHESTKKNLKDSNSQNKNKRKYKYKIMIIILSTDNYDIDIIN